MVWLIFMQYDIFGIKKVYKDLYLMKKIVKKKTRKDKEIPFDEVLQYLKQIDDLKLILIDVEISLMKAKGFTREKWRNSYIKRLDEFKKEFFEFNSYILDYHNKLIEKEKLSKKENCLVAEQLGEDD